VTAEDAGATTAASGTPVAVDLARDRRTRGMWVILLGGPLLWLTHFMFVYLVAEAGCSGDGPGLELFDPPVPKTLTLVVTALAVAACVPLAFWCLGHWRRATQGSADSTEPGGGRTPDAAGQGTVPYAGFLLASFSAVAILFVGVPAAFLPAC
jgi:hypothetical protein